MQPMPAEKAKEPIGLIAGNGAFPILFARAATRAGHRVIAVAHRGETDPALHAHVHALTWVRVGQVGAIVQAFKRAHVGQAAMAGGIDKRRALARLRPDWCGLKLMWRIARKRDDALLRAVAQAFEHWGVRIISSTTFVPQALAPTGVLGRAQPNAKVRADLHEGLRLAHAIGALDVGQTVAIKEGTVLALEALEGTDACILRAGALCGHRGAVVVKAAKPGQDMRFDVPTIGPETIRTARQAGVVAIGIEAGRTLLLEAEATIKLADEANISLVGLRGDAS